MSRWKAAGIHLCISIAIIVAVAAALILLWYGVEFFPQMGGARQLAIMAVIDVVIGPLLTLIVFKSGKPSLKFDLAVIALLQAGFLAYGLKVMSESRPVFLVAAADRFELVFANELDPEDLAKGSQPEYRTLSWTGPRLVGGNLGGTSQERLELIMSAFGGKDVQLRPERYVDYAQVAPELVQHAAPVGKLASTSDRARAKLEKAVARTGRPAEELGTLPIASARGNATMLVDASSGEPLARLALDPWPEVADKQ